jgi:proteasome accessory factor C
MYNQHKILRVFQLINLLKSSPTKSIRALSKTLNIDNRSVYRYFDLLRELGFQLEKDTYNRFYIVNEESEDEFSFSPEEAGWLKELISTVGKESYLKDSILKKLYVNSDLKIQSKQLFKVHLAKLVEVAKKGIEEKKQVILRKYYSANSQNIEDRLVEPIHFTDNYQHLVAFEVASETIKHFHLERIGEIEIQSNVFRYEEQHRHSETDIFGFAPNGQSKRIYLLLSLRAYVFLKEEYPLSIPYISYDKKSDKYKLKATVNSLLPVERFVKGLSGEVEVILQ